MKTPFFFVLLFALILGARLCHVHVLWAEENLPLASAGQMLMGKMLYRDIWFDKPPLVPAIYLLWAVKTGWVLRLAGSLYAVLACFVAYCFARDLWGRKEGMWAGALMAFFLIFDTASAVLPLAADLLMLVPHIAAVYLAWRGQAFWSGVVAGIGFLFNAKAAFVLLVASLFSFPALLPLVGGFIVPNAIAAGWLWTAGAFPAYIDQVWIWPSLYAQRTFLPHPVTTGLSRTLNWLGFHLAIVVAALLSRARQQAAGKMLAWFILSLAGVTVGWRFFPRYYFQLLPVLVILASRGFVALGRKRIFLALLLLAPLVRFGPRYAILAAGTQPDWSDTAMDRDSRESARVVNSQKQPGDTLFVWGFRPEIFVYTDLPAATRFLDSQALTGVPADRHLTQSQPVLTEDSTKAARAELTRSRPSVIVDGLGAYNPALAMTQYPELREWLSGYRAVARTRTTVIYRLLAAPASRPLAQER